VPGTGPERGARLVPRSNKGQRSGLVSVPSRLSRNASIARTLVLATLIAFVVGFGGGAVALRSLQPTLAGAEAPAALAGVPPGAASPGVGPSEAGEPAVARAAPRGAASVPRQMWARTPRPPATPIPFDLDEALETPTARLARPETPAAARPEIEVPVDLDALVVVPPVEGPEDGPGEAAARVAHQVDVRRGDTLMSILTRLGIGRAEAHAAIASLSELYDPRRLRAGQQLALELDEDDGEGAQLASLSLALGFAEDVLVTRDDDGGFAALTVERALQHDTAHGAGRIDGSFYAAGQRAGVPASTLAEMIRVFSWDVDFQRDVHPGDAFETVFETVSTEDGSAVRAGELLFASLVLGGRPLEAYRFEREDGSIDFFGRDGRSLRKFLLRTPIDGARMSSGFGPRRHPILGYNRMHRGVDFAAPTGTPIYAAGDGVVEAITSNRGYGNYVKIRHNGTYSTLYAHLSRFERGLSRGDRVRQGEVIGYVGATGMATGPHLHYEVHRNGDQVNPLEVDVAEADGLSGAELSRFRETIAEVDHLRRVLGRGTVVADRRD
jgi:murein DD-endopeptidase MepM/ murein hydrolase activator NlpD